MSHKVITLPTVLLYVPKTQSYCEFLNTTYQGIGFLHQDEGQTVTHQEATNQNVGKLSSGSPDNWGIVVSDENDKDARGQNNSI